MHEPRVHRTARRWVLVLLLTSAAACSSGEKPTAAPTGATSGAPSVENDASAPAVEADSPTSVAGTDVRSPVRDLEAQTDPYDLVRLNPDEAGVVYRATEKSLRSCLSERGFEYVELPTPNYDLILDQNERTRVDAETLGYLPNRQQGTQYSEEETLLNDRLASESTFSEAYFGPENNPSEGCYSIAQQEIYGPDEQGFPALQATVELQRAEAAATIRASADFLKLEQDWAACIFQEGYQYTSFDQLFETDWQGTRPTDVEVATAIADFDCQTTLGVQEFLANEMGRLSDEWIESNPGLLEAIQVARSGMLDRSIVAMEAA